MCIIHQVSKGDCEKDEQIYVMEHNYYLNRRTFSKGKLCLKSKYEKIFKGFLRKLPSTNHTNLQISSKINAVNTVALI